MFFGRKADVLQPDALGMSYGESPCRLNAVCRWLGVVCLAKLIGFSCRRNEERIHSALLAHIVERYAAAIFDVYVFNAHVSYGMSICAGNDAGVAAVGILHAHVADAYSVYRRMMKTFWRSHAVAQPDIDRRVADVVHTYVANAYVLDCRAVYRFQGKTAAMLECASAYCYVSESTVRFRAQFYAPCRTVAVGRFYGCCGACSVNHRAYVETANVAVLNQNVLSWFFVAKRV